MRPQATVVALFVRRAARGAVRHRLHPLSAAVRCIDVPKAWTSTGAGGVAGLKDNGSSPSFSSDESGFFGVSRGQLALGTLLHSNRSLSGATLQA
jgi:hypothetical protein